MKIGEALFMIRYHLKDCGHIEMADLVLQVMKTLKISHEAAFDANLVEDIGAQVARDVSLEPR